MIPHATLPICGCTRKKAQVDTIRVSDEMNVDIAPDGTVYGIELLNANAQLEAEDDGRLLSEIGGKVNC